MSNESRSWHRVAPDTIMVCLMGAPAFVYTTLQDTDRAMDAASEFHGSALDYGEPEEFMPGDESDHPDLDGDELAEGFLVEAGEDAEISVIEVWPSEAE